MKASINPTVLHWAIQDFGITDRAVAEKLKVPADTLHAWVAGADQPSVTQLRQIAALLRRTLSFFFLPAPPASDTPKVAFRAAPGKKEQVLSADARVALREAHNMQEFLAWLARELRLGTAHVPEISRNTQPHVVAAKVREQLGVSLEEQLGWRSPNKALREWRLALEAKGVSVFFSSLADGPRGFSISNQWNPLVVVNTHAWNAGARIFTLVHELAHILRASDSSCMTIGTSTDSEEQWCDRFAAAFLMPWQGVVDHLIRRHRWDEKTPIDDLDVVRQMATRFKVSMHAAAVRLVSQGAAEGALLGAIPSASNTNKGFGPSDPDKSRVPYRRLQQYGLRTVALLKRAIAQDLVTTHEALTRMRCNFDEFEDMLAQAEGV